MFTSQIVSPRHPNSTLSNFCHHSMCMDLFVSTSPSSAVEMQNEANFSTFTQNPEADSESCCSYCIVACVWLCARLCLCFAWVFVWCSLQSKRSFSLALNLTLRNPSIMSGLKTSHFGMLCEEEGDHSFPHSLSMDCVCVVMGWGRAVIYFEKVKAVCHPLL